MLACLFLPAALYHNRIQTDPVRGNAVPQSGAGVEKPHAAEGRW